MTVSGNAKLITLKMHFFHKSQGFQGCIVKWVLEDRLLDTSYFVLLQSSGEFRFRILSLPFSNGSFVRGLVRLPVSLSVIGTCSSLILFLNFLSDKIVA